MFGRGVGDVWDSDDDVWDSDWRCLGQWLEIFGTVMEMFGRVNGDVWDSCYTCLGHLLKCLGECTIYLVSDAICPDSEVYMPMTVMLYAFYSDTLCLGQ